MYCSRTWLAHNYTSTSSLTPLGVMSFVLPGIVFEIHLLFTASTYATLVDTNY